MVLQTVCHLNQYATVLLTTPCFIVYWISTMTGQKHTWNSFCISYSRSVRTKYWSDTSGEHFKQAKHGHSDVSHSGLIHACWSGSTVLQCLRCFNWFNCLSWRHQTCDHAMAAVMLPCSTWRAHFKHVTSNLFPPFFWDNKAEHNLQHWPMDLSSTPRCTQRIPVKEKKSPQHQGTSPQSTGSWDLSSRLYSVHKYAKSLPIIWSFQGFLALSTYKYSIATKCQKHYAVICLKNM